MHTDYELGRLVDEAASVGAIVTFYPHRFVVLVSAETDVGECWTYMGMERVAQVFRDAAVSMRQEVSRRERCRASNL